MANNETKNAVRLDFEDWRYDEWTFEVGEESYSIEKGGSEVPADKENDVKKAAEEQGIKLRRAK
jgi:hypothetical protein